MSRVLVLMYHALYTDTAEREALDAPDRPYAVSLESFRAQLRFLQEAKIPVLDRQALKRPVTGLPQWSVFMTFDDGHDSNHRLALAALKDHGMRATFFVTSNFIGQRPGFCSAHDLRELAEAGMDVQSHGQTHLFFDDLSPEAARQEYAVSKSKIEQWTGRAVDALSFPGGRFNRHSLVLGRSAGYQDFFTSNVGVARARDFLNGLPIDRMAMKGLTPYSLFQRWVTNDTWSLTKAKGVADAKRLARRLLGNRLYHSLYERLAS